MNVLELDLEKFVRTMEPLLYLLKDIWDYLKVRKKWWLPPFLLTLFLIVALVFLTEGSIIAPFIYSIR